MPLALAPALALAPLTAQAGSGYDRAKVVAAQPIYQSVSYSVPVEQCYIEQVPVYGSDRNSGYRSYTVPILGAIIGGAIGNAVGHNKTNKKVGTVVGAVLGGTIGRDISHRNRTRYDHHSGSYRSEEVCQTVDEIRETQELTGYDVTYRYAGEIHSARMDHDPGKFVRVRVQVTPV